MTRTHQIFGVMVALAISALLIFAATLTRAQDIAITYPVAELGGCGSKDECRAYCDDLAHVNECVAFAEAHGLMDTEEAEDAREFAKLGGEGPGGCTSKDECEAYCENVTHIDECLAFAETHGILSDDELEEARQVARALGQGAELPGGCTSKRSCEAYCEDPSHMRQCLAFAKQAGFMDEKELAEAEKVAAYLESGGAMPGGCRGERECKAYCEGGDHMEECAEFAIQAGFMSQKEAEMFRKTGGKGPGGCRGRECEAYCEDEAHREQCIAFAMEHDLMSEEDKQRMEEGKTEARRVLENAPAEVLTCIEEKIGKEKLDQIRRGEGFIGPSLGQVIPECMRSVMGNENTGPFSRGVPAEATDCMRKVFGEDFEDKMRKGEIDPGAHDGEIRSCMQEQLGEGYLRDDGAWERPQMGMPPEGEYPMQPPQGEYGEMRGMMEGQYPRSSQPYEGMRMEMEAQMRSGNFDPSRLPPDFRPEGFMPPPESFNRPPEGYMNPGMMPGEGAPPPEDREPVSSAYAFLANVITVIEVLMGQR